MLLILLLHDITADAHAKVWPEHGTTADNFIHLHTKHVHTLEQPPDPPSLLALGGNNIGACGVLVLFCFLVSWRAWLPATFVGCSSVALDRYYVSLCVPLLLALFLYPVLLSLVSRLSVLVLFLSSTPRASGCLQ